MHSTVRDARLIHTEKMLSRVKKCLCFFELLIQTYKVSPALSKTLIGKATKTQLVCIAEIVLNTLNDNLEISDSTRRTLVKSKRVLRKVARVARLMLEDSEERQQQQQHKQSHSDTRGSTQPQHSKSSIRAERVQALKTVCLTHYKTLINFLDNCMPYIKRLTSEDDAGDEI